MPHLFQTLEVFKMKAQTGMEYIIMFGFSLLILSAIWIGINYRTSATDIELQTAYAQNAVDKMAEASDSVYVQGYPARVTIRVVFPKNVESAYLSGNEIILTLNRQGSLVNISATAMAPLFGNLSAYRGIHTILIKAEDGQVNVTG